MSVIEKNHIVAPQCTYIASFFFFFFSTGTGPGHASRLFYVFCDVGIGLKKVGGGEEITFGADTDVTGRASGHSGGPDGLRAHHRSECDI